MKNILMIAPFFAPYSHAAVYRAHRFAKYLPRLGWKPYVLTAGKSFLYFVDPTLLDDLPEEVEIIRARLMDEYARGKVDNSHKLWTIMILEIWCRRFLDFKR